TTTSGSNDRARSRASAPSSAVETSYPSSSRRSTRRSSIFRSSSTIRTRPRSEVLMLICFPDAMSKKPREEQIGDGAEFLRPDTLQGRREYNTLRRCLSGEKSDHKGRIEAQIRRKFADFCASRLLVVHALTCRGLGGGS